MPQIAVPSSLATKESLQHANVPHLSRKPVSCNFYVIYNLKIWKKDMFNSRNEVIANIDKILVLNELIYLMTVQEQSSHRYLW